MCSVPSFRNASAFCTQTFQFVGGWELVSLLNISATGIKLCLIGAVFQQRNVLIELVPREYAKWS